MKRAALFGVVALLVGLSSGAAAQSTGDDNASVTVGITGTVSLDINPTSLEYTGLQPKTFQADSDNGFPGVEIENSGSTNISDVKLNVTNNADDPFGTGLQGEYNAGNLLQARPEDTTESVTINPDDATIDGNTDPAGYHYVTRTDFNESRELSYIKTPTTEGSEDQSSFDWHYGRFRSGNESFFWAVRTDNSDSADNNICDGGTDNTLLRVGTVSHTDDRKGTTDFTDDNEDDLINVSVGESGNSAPYGRVNNIELNTTTGNTTYTALTYCDDADGGTDDDADGQTFVTRTRFDLNPFDTNSLPDLVTSPLAETSGSLEKVTDAENVDQQIQPGEHYTLFTAVEVGRGVASGQLQQGTLQLIGTQAS